MPQEARLDRVMALHIRDRFPVDADTFWHRVFLSEDYQRRNHLEGMGFRSYQLVSATTPDSGAATRTIQVDPGTLPGVLSKVLGSVGYTETGAFDPVRQRWSFTIQPAKVGDRIQVRGELWVEPRPGGVERFCDVDVQVRLPGLGGRVQKAMEAMTRENQDKSTAFTLGFIAEQGLG